MKPIEASLEQKQAYYDAQQQAALSQTIEAVPQEEGPTSYASLRKWVPLFEGPTKWVPQEFLHGL